MIFLQPPPSLLVAVSPFLCLQTPVATLSHREQVVDVEVKLPLFVLELWLRVDRLHLVQVEVNVVAEALEAGPVPLVELNLLQLWVVRVETVPAGRGQPAASAPLQPLERMH